MNAWNYIYGFDSLPGFAEQAGSYIFFFLQ